MSFMRRLLSNSGITYTQRQAPYYGQRTSGPQSPTGNQGRDQYPTPPTNIPTAASANCLPLVGICNHCQSTVTPRYMDELFEVHASETLGEDYDSRLTILEVQQEMVKFYGTRENIICETCHTDDNSLSNSEEEGEDGDDEYRNDSSLDQEDADDVDPSMANGA